MGGISGKVEGGGLWDVAGIGLREEITDGLGDDQFFVGGDDADDDAAGRGGNDVRIGGIGGGVDGHAKVREAAADFGANFGGVLADAAGEDQGIQAIQRGGVGADEFSG